MCTEDPIDPVNRTCQFQSLPMVGTSRANTCGISDNLDFPVQRPQPENVLGTSENEGTINTPYSCLVLPIYVLRIITLSR